MTFPQRLIDGYSAFPAGGCARAGPLSRARRNRPAPRDHGDRLLRFARSRRRSFSTRGPGELFVVRNIANIVPPYAPDASGARRLGGAGVRRRARCKVKHIVVLGHAQCGGVKAFAEDAEPLSPGDFIGKWMALMAPAADKVGPRGDVSAERISDASSSRPMSRNSLDNLMTFPRLAQTDRERRASRLHGAYFGVATGELSVLRPAQADNSRRSRRSALRASSSRAAVLGLRRFLLRADQLAVDQASRRSAWR